MKIPQNSGKFKFFASVLNPACLKGAFAKGCFLAFDVLQKNTLGPAKVFRWIYTVSIARKNCSRKLLGGQKR